MSESAQWVLGISLGVVVILVAAALVITIVLLAMRIARQARTAEEAVVLLRQQTAELPLDDPTELLVIVELGQTERRVSQPRPILVDEEGREPRRLDPYTYQLHSYSFSAAIYGNSPARV